MHIIGVLLWLYSHRLGFGQLQCRNPGLALHLVGGLNMERLRSPIRYGKCARVHGVYESAMQRNSSPASVAHLGLVSVGRQKRNRELVLDESG